MSRYQTKAGLVERCVVHWLAQSGEHSPYKGGVSGSDPELAVQFSHCLTIQPAKCHRVSKLCGQSRT